MGFVDVNLSDVVLTKPEVPAGTYVFQLLPGAHYRVNPFTSVEELNVSAAVAEGENAGKVQFWNYPDPTTTDKKGKSRAWSAQALKKLEVSMGIDSNPGEDPATYLNRVATEGGGRFTGTISSRTFTNTKTGKEQTKTEFSLFDVEAAA